MTRQAAIGQRLRILDDHLQTQREPDWTQEKLLEV